VAESINVKATTAAEAKMRFRIMLDLLLSRWSFPLMWLALARVLMGIVLQEAVL